MLNEIDQLSYTYDTDNKNLLLKVDDASNSPQGFKDNYASTGNDYSYDANGNMIADQNKDIHGISYNHLNLPVQITFSGTTNGTISYLYNALGQKVKKTVNNGVSVHTDYLSGFQYQNEVLDFFPHAEGYVKATEMMAFMGGRSYGFNYVFNYTDHLGNIRLSYSKDPSTQVLKIIEENHYYPFGLKHTGYNSDEQMYAKDGSLIRIRPVPPLFTTSYDYKYNGKEYQDELGLNFYDYGARNYDPSLGRWMNVDPLAEEFPEWSPYSFVFNNPLRFIDPDGRAPFDWIKNKSTGQVVWNATATSPTNTPTGYDYVGKSYQGITILNYGAHSTRGAGVEIEAGYDDGKSTSPNARWVQTVRTNDPLGGATSPYNDPQPGDDNKPFYWTDSELPSYQNTKGQDLLFYDRPTRSSTKSGVNWEGELSLVIDSGNGYQPQVTITYGFEIKGGVAVPTNLVVSQPSNFQSTTIDNYNATQIGPRLPDGSF